MRFPAIRFTASCDSPCRISARRRPKDSPSGALGTITAQSGCQTTVAANLALTGGFSAARQRLREWLCDGADRSTPSPNQIDVRARFAPLMRWGLSLWKSNDLALAIDPTTLSDKLCAIVASAGLSGMRHPGRVGRPARQVDSLRSRAPRSAVRRHSHEYEGNRDD